MPDIRRPVGDPKAPHFAPYKGKKHSLHMKDGKRGWVDDKGDVRYDDPPEEEETKD